MRPLVFSFLPLLISISIHALGQSIPDGQQLIQKKCAPEHARLWQDKYRNYPELFNEIHVLDARPDTTRIGIVRIGAQGQAEILLEGPVTAELTKYLNVAYARPKGGHTLLIVLKDLWIVSAYDFHFHVEAWLNAKDGFMPMMSMDTLLSGLKGETAGVIAGKQTRVLLAEFMNQIAAKDLGKGRRIVSAEQIDSFNRARFAYPMDTAKQLVKGVYNSVEEFLNNAPSIGNAELGADKTGSLELRIPDQNGQLYYTRSVWGFCDGSRAYVMIDGNLFRVFSICHQFYVLGSKEYRQKIKKTFVVIPGMPLAASVLFYMTSSDTEPLLTRKLRVYRIDTGTGEVTD